MQPLLYCLTLLLKSYWNIISFSAVLCASVHFDIATTRSGVIPYNSVNYLSLIHGRDQPIVFDAVHVTLGCMMRG